MLPDDLSASLSLPCFILKYLFTDIDESRVSFSFCFFFRDVNLISRSVSLPAFCSQDTRLCERCGKNKVMVTRYSEGYGTEVTCSICVRVFMTVLCVQLLNAVAERCVWSPDM